MVVRKQKDQLEMRHTPYVSSSSVVVIVFDRAFSESLNTEMDGRAGTVMMMLMLIKALLSAIAVPIPIDSKPVDVSAINHGKAFAAGGQNKS